MSTVLRKLFPPFSRKMRLASRPLFVWRIVFAGAVVVLLCLLVPQWRNREWLFGLLAVVGGVGYFLIQQHLNESKFFFELFEKFNDRYGGMNDRLQKLLDEKASFTRDDKLFVIDYFNLCAEEYLFASAGYIDPGVWIAWRTGINTYADDERFADLWKDEGGGASYYGFDFLNREQGILPGRARNNQ